MVQDQKPNILEQQEFYDCRFVGLKLDQVELRNKVFENCQFHQSTFKEAKFLTCKFVDCEFEACDLSAAIVENSIFNEVVFDQSKVIGINWTQAHWPTIKLASSLQFYRSDISHSSFYQLDLAEMIIEECKAHDVDFRACNLSNGSFVSTDFECSAFMHTKLYATDFTDAYNYNIDPIENDIRKGKFSMPDVVNLLHSFNIQIDGDDV